MNAWTEVQGLEWHQTAGQSLRMEGRPQSLMAMVGEAAAEKEMVKDIPDLWSLLAVAFWNLLQL